MYPWIRGHMVADTLESAKYKLGITGLDQIHIYETNFCRPCPASLLLTLFEFLFFDVFSHWVSALSILCQLSVTYGKKKKHSDLTCT